MQRAHTAIHSKSESIKEIGIRLIFKYFNNFSKYCQFSNLLSSLLGTPVSRIPIMAKQVLDLFRLYKLVVERGGLVEVINKKIWREITKGLNLPSSITSAAFTLRTQ